jgi:hypothetical protein
LVFPPFHFFVGVRGASLPNFTCLLQTRFEGEFVFLFSNVCFLMTLFLVLIVYVFFWIMLINNFSLLCGEII